METLPLHPKLVHLPIALTLLMPLITAGLLLAWWRGLLPRRAWWAAVGMQALLVGSGFAAYLSGEAEEGKVKELVPHDALEAHEEAATLLLIGAGVALALGLAAALWRSEAVARLVAAVTVVATVAGVALGFRVGEAGGRLVYQHGAAEAYRPAVTGGAAGSAPASGATNAASP